MDRETFVKPFIVPPGKRISLAKDYDPGYKNAYSTQADADEVLKAGIDRLAEFQAMLYAQDTFAMLIIFQAMDAAGKDGVIKHVMSGVNPQGVQVFSFKVPSAEELDHDYMWRNFKALPERGRIGIFNRSYYEEVLVVRVHPEILARQQLPPALRGEGIWRRRFDEINHFEKYLVDNGIVVLKFFLNVSKEEQKERFLARIDEPDKNWKFSVGDVHERVHWDDYMAAYEDMFNHTSTKWAPWYIIPADRKWFTRLAVAGVIDYALQDLKLAYPKVGEERLQELQAARQMLESEAD
jgi:PPK2 family polyphosphate:nucleotide phosphotransferase